MGPPENEHSPLNLIEKIIAANTIELNSINYVRPGNVLILRVSWILSSEASWVGISKTFSQLGRPRVHRKDRIWLAQDHTVDPRINSRSQTQKTIELAEAAAKETGIIDFYGPNYTITHTEFCREMAQPGQIVGGADSHTCSAGSTRNRPGHCRWTIPMIAGETWLAVPQVLCNKFINEPSFGIGGKDIILYVLGLLKWNTVAGGRAVEFTGPGLTFLSADARFAISNMTTEFGVIVGVFTPDETITTYINSRKDPQPRDSALDFRSDDGAQYAAIYEIELSKLGSLIALYPSSDNTVPTTQVLGKDKQSQAQLSPEDARQLVPITAGKGQQWKPAIEGKCVIFGDNVDTDAVSSRSIWCQQDCICFGKS